MAAQSNDVCICVCTHASMSTIVGNHPRNRLSLIKTIVKVALGAVGYQNQTKLDACKSLLLGSVRSVRTQMREEAAMN